MQLQWTLATFWGWPIGIVCILLLASLFHAAGIERAQFFVGTGIGAGVGCMQWRVLNGRIGVGKEWIWATAAGTTLPFLLSDGLKIFTGLLAGKKLYCRTRYFPDSSPVCCNTAFFAVIFPPTPRGLP